MSGRGKRAGDHLLSGREQMIPALLKERETYVRYGKADRVRAVDEQLALYGYDPKVGFEPAPVEDEQAPVEVDGERRRRDMVRALLEERAEYEQKRLPDRVRLVDEQLAHYGHEGGSAA